MQAPYQFYPNQYKSPQVVKSDINKYAQYISYILIGTPILVILMILLGFSFASFGFLIFLILVAAGLGIANLIFTWKLGTGFVELGTLYPIVYSQANKAGKNLRYYIILTLVSAVPYIGSIASIVGFVLLGIAYYNIGETFRVLKQNDLFPKKESKLLFYSYLGGICFGIISFVIGISVFMNAYYYYDPYYSYSINYTPIILFIVFCSIGGISLFIMQVLGYKRVSDDILLISEDLNKAQPRYPPYYNYAQSQTPNPHMYSPPPKREYNATYSPPNEQTIKVKTPDSSESRELIAYCSNCGTRIEGHANFCQNCGATLSGE